MDSEEHNLKDNLEREKLLNWLQSECVLLKSKKARKKASGHTAGEMHCKACDAHLSFDEALTHVRTDTHQKRKMKREKATDPQADVSFVTEELLSFLPEPSVAHYAALQHTLAAAYQRLRLSNSEIQSRYEIVAQLERLANEEVSSQLPYLRVQLTIFGSVRARVASRRSDTNVFVNVLETDSRKRAAVRERRPSETNPTFVVARIVRAALERSGVFESVQDAVESGSDCDAPLCFECRLCSELRSRQAERAGVNTLDANYERQSKFVFVYDPFGERAALRSADLLRCYALLNADLNCDAMRLNGDGDNECESRREAGDDYVTRALLALVRDWFAEARVDRAESGTMPGVAAYWMAVHFLQRAGHLPVLHAFHDYRPDKRHLVQVPPALKEEETNGDCRRHLPTLVKASSSGSEDKDAEGDCSSPSKTSKATKARPTATVTILRRSANSTNTTDQLETPPETTVGWCYNENNALHLTEAQCEQLEPHTLASRCTLWAQNTAAAVHGRVSWARLGPAPEQRSIWPGARPPPDSPLARLFVAFLRYFALEFDFAERVIAIRCGVLTRKAKLWHAKRAALEEPFALRANVCRSLATSDSFEHVLDRLQRAFAYFCVPQLARQAASRTNGLRALACEPAFTRLRLRRCTASRVDEVDVHLDTLRYEVLPGYTVAEQLTSSEQVFRLVTLADVCDGEVSHPASYYEKERIDQLAERDIRIDLKLSLWSFRKRSDRAEDSGTTATRAEEDESQFEVQDVPPYCADCNKAGHLKAACPQNALPTINLEPARCNRAFLDALSNVLSQLEREHTPSEHDEAARERVASELRSVIGRLASTAELHTFGSSRNGFAFPRSDLDFCLKLADIDDARRINVRTVLRDVHRALHRDTRFDQLHAVLSAKVPIVRFRHLASRLDGDISVYNCLAIENTRMMRLYRDLDPRVKTLGYVLKYLTKLCDISDASKGSLSSYAYTLMLIYFLQQRSPPVLPVLQELYDSECAPMPSHQQLDNNHPDYEVPSAGTSANTRSRLKSDQRPVRVVDSWDCWFQEDREAIRRIFRAQNEESVAELWLGFLAFYTTEFAYKRLVVAIRQRARLYKREKCWSGSSDCLAIEDPFELSHNLGCGLTYKMNMYILRVFHNELKRCCEAALLSPSCLSQSRLFDVEAISPGEVPMDRCCRKCGHIGHIARECRVGQEEPDFDLGSFPPLLNCIAVPLLGTQPGLLGVGPQAPGIISAPQQPPSLISAPPFLASNLLNAQVVQRFTELASFAPFAMPPRFGPNPGSAQPPLSASGRPEAFHPAFFAQPTVSAVNATANGPPASAFIAQSTGNPPNGVADTRRDGNFGAGLGYAYTPFGAPTSVPENHFTGVLQNMHIQQPASTNAFRGPPAPSPATYGAPFSAPPFNVHQSPYAAFSVPSAFIGQPTQRPTNAVIDTGIPTVAQAHTGALPRTAFAQSQAVSNAHVNSANMNVHVHTMTGRAPPDPNANSSWSDIVKKQPKRH